MSGTGRLFTSGCYRNLPCLPGESLPGYLLRLAEANAYDGIRELLAMAEIDVAGGISKLITRVKISPEDLGAVGAMAVGDRRHLLTYLAQPIGDDAVFVHGCRVDNDAFLVERAQVCPRCLRDDGFAREEWELAVVTACTQHKVRLNDCCHVCKAQIEWTRSLLNHCDRCGADFRDSPVATASDSLCDVADDFSALAPFRFKVHDDERQVHMWDTAFRLFKSLAHDGGHWVKAEWLERLVQSRSIETRHAVTELLAGARFNGCYDLLTLNDYVSELMAPLRAIPKPGLLQSHAMRMLHSEAALPWAVASAICSPGPLRREPRGAHVFKGHPPTIDSLSGLAKFLAVDQETVAGLIFIRKVERPSGEYPGFDIDKVLAAQKFLTEGLLSLMDLVEIVGVPLDWHDPLFSQLFPVWNTRNYADSRFSVEQVAGIQANLISLWCRSPRPAKPVVLGELARAALNPFQSVAKGVVSILTSGIQRMDWGPPFDWASLVVDEHDANVVLGASE